MMTSPFPNANAPLLDDREDGADIMLIGAHAAGDAVHDDADVSGF